MKPALLVQVEWRLVTTKNRHLLDTPRALYAYSDRADHLLYVGKADFSTVRQRFDGHCRDGVGEHLDSVGVSGVHVRVGQIGTNARLTVALLSDVESLLIHGLKPCANVQNRRTRPIQRPGMQVDCAGDWPWEPLSFLDKPL